MQKHQVVKMTVTMPVRKSKGNTAMPVVTYRNQSAKFTLKVTRTRRGQTEMSALAVNKNCCAFSLVKPGCQILITHYNYF